MTSPAPVVVGYFVWLRNMRGTPVPSKWSKDFWDTPMPETRKARENVIIKSHPLTIDEFALDLAALAARYPIT